MASRSLQVGQLGEQPPGPLGVGHDGALGDLELEQVGGHAPVGRGQLSPSWGKPSSSRLRVDRLMAMDSSFEPRPGLSRATAGTGAARSLSTQVVSGLISPVCSATGMNSPGGRSPSAGCCHRTRASDALDLTGVHGRFRLVVQHELVVGHGVRRSPSRVRRAGRVDVELLGIGDHVHVRALGHVHGHVGPLQQQIGVVAVARGPWRCRSRPRCRGPSRRSRSVGPGRR